jgi:hypothetical protein
LPCHHAASELLPAFPGIRVSATNPCVHDFCIAGQPSTLCTVSLSPVGRTNLSAHGLKMQLELLVIGAQLRPDFTVDVIKIELIPRTLDRNFREREARFPIR